MSAEACDLRRRSWPTLPPRAVAALLAGHGVVGLTFGALLYLVCLTGALSVFVDEWKWIEAPSPPVTALAPGALDRAVAAAPRTGVLFITAPTAPFQRWTLSAGDEAWHIDSQGGLTSARTPWSDFVTNLHMTLTLPAPWGSLAVGILGAALLSLILSGVLAHPRILRDAFVLRLGGSRRLQEADLHNRLSVWGLPFHVAVSLTGAFFGLSNLALMAVAALGFHGDMARAAGPLRGPATIPDARPAPLPRLDPLVRRALALRPGAGLSYIGVEQPGTRGQQIAVETAAPGRLPRGEQAYFDGAGRMIGRGRFASGPAGLQIYAGAAQLHFGFFGGLPVRIAYGVLGAALALVSASGVRIWLARRRDRGRPAPRLERAWAGWTWGAPASLAVAALTAAILPVAWVFWLSAAAIQLLAQIRWPRLFPAREESA
jgi:uncharacterized iron-regulated membrane protein